MSAVQGHYTRDEIAQRVLAAARAAAGPGVPLTPDVLAPIDHFHGGGLASTRELMACSQPEAGETVLDIGCGIGGPARWIASTFGCQVTGIDLTAAFCRAAEMLNAETGLGDKVKIFEASALALPFEPESFDRAYSQNVVMNIADKKGFYREAFRVLRPGRRAGHGKPLRRAGRRALLSGAVGDHGGDQLPVDAGGDAARSRADGVRGRAVRGHVGPHGRRAAAQRLRLESEGLPALGFHVFMGAHMLEAMINTARSAEEGRGTSVEILVRKPG